jgi:hypothetical protein
MADVVKGQVHTPTPRERFTKLGLDRAALESNFDADELIESQMSDILSAETEDALFDAMGLEGLKGLKDIPAGTILQINSYEFHKGSARYGGPGFFAIMQAQDVATGEELTIDTGVERIMGFLRMVESGQAGVKFPITVRVVKKETAEGEAVTFAKVKK